MDNIMKMVQSKISPNDFFSLSEMIKEHVSNIEKGIIEKRIPFGDFPAFNYSLEGGIAEDYLVTVLGLTGGNKTNLALNVLLNHLNNNPDELVLYFSLEMSKRVVNKRIIQMSLGISSRDFKRKSEKKDKDYLKSIEELLVKGDNFIMIEKRISIFDIPLYMKHIQKYFEKKLGMVCVDTLGLITNKELKTEYERITFNIETLQGIAKELSIPIVVISQINRMEAKSNEININAGKGSGSIETSSDLEIAIRVINENDIRNFSIEPSTYRKCQEKGITLLSLSILKNKEGLYTKVILELNQKTLRITESDYNYENKKVSKSDTKLNENEQETPF